jgi:hypothetical protein
MSHAKPNLAGIDYPKPPNLLVQEEVDEALRARDNLQNDEALSALREKLLGADETQKWAIFYFWRNPSSPQWYTGHVTVIGRTRDDALIAFGRETWTSLKNEYQIHSMCRFPRP